ncbi:biogenesis protein MshI [Marinobacter salinisoli]|uniref:Biogenesis protein MshI n=1 Tax=Marinobacter salinisoli TaxID=2769486 RepID=A0ABX7MY33_9GAMM|nr:biogenesis protein MshI [Marinobacter salinisoli]QSP96026.1 biogenesis protein MshI [Marinobacter salinisoli]
MTTRSMFSRLAGLLNRAGGRRSHVCLEVRPDGIAWAAVASGASPASGFVECMPAKRLQTLQGLVDQRNWSGARTTLVLPLDQYQVFQMERPEGVDESELADALKWKLKDFLDFPPSDAVSDVFPFPEDASRGRGALVNVVSARKSLVQELVTLVRDTGLELVTIDIAELALRNLVSVLDQNGRGAALVHLRDGYGQMVVCRKDTLYLSRRLDVAANDLMDVARQENAVQSLALEMQRSLDYYESQLGQVPPATIQMVARDKSLPLASMVSSYVAASVQMLDWSSLGAEANMDSRCLPAWSAALPMAGGERS